MPQPENTNPQKPQDIRDALRRAIDQGRINLQMARDAWLADTANNLPHPSTMESDYIADAILTTLSVQPIKDVETHITGDKYFTAQTWLLNMGVPSHLTETYDHLANLTRINWYQNRITFHESAFEGRTSMNPLAILIALLEGADVQTISQALTNGDGKLTSLK